MKIGELAEVAGVSTSSIRFYEKHGLIPQPERRNNGYRDYPDAMVSRLRTIVMSKSLGFSLSEIRQFLPEDPNDLIERSDIIANLEKKLIDVDQKLRDLRVIRQNLNEMIAYMRDPDAKC